MQIEVEITRTDFLEFNKSVLKRNRTKQSFLIATIFVILWLFILNINSAFNIYTIIGELVIFYSCWGIFILLVRLFVNWKIKNYPDSKGVVLGHKKFTILEHGFKEESDVSETLTKWKGIKKIVDIDNYIFVFVDNIAAHIVPKRYFQSDIQTAEFIELLHTRTSANK